MIFSLLWELRPLSRRRCLFQGLHGLDTGSRHACSGLSHFKTHLALSKHAKKLVSAQCPVEDRPPVNRSEGSPSTHVAPISRMSTAPAFAHSRCAIHSDNPYPPRLIAQREEATEARRDAGLPDARCVAALQSPAGEQDRQQHSEQQQCRQQRSNPAADCASPASGAGGGMQPEQQCGGHRWAAAGR